VALIFGNQLTRHALETFGFGRMEILPRGCLLNLVGIGFEVDMERGAATVDVSGHPVALQYSIKILSNLLRHLVGSPNRLPRRYLLQNDDSRRGCQG